MSVDILTSYSRSSRWALVSLAVAMGALTDVTAARAQVQRQPSGTVSAQVDPNTVHAMVDPLKTEVAALRVEVNRLQAALASLRLTGQTNQAAYLKHRHSVASYGLLTAKTISPQAPPDVQLAFTAPGAHTKALTGPPE